MGITAYFFIGVFEFFLINWLGRHSITSGYYQISFVQNVEDAPLFNFVFRVLAPNVFLVVTATALYSLGFVGTLGDYWIVTAWYFAVRWTYNLVMGRAALLNWPKQITTAIAGVGLSILIATKLLGNRELILPSARGLTDQLWIVILGFLYITATRVGWPNVGKSAVDRKNVYLRNQFSLARKRFGEVISVHSGKRSAEVYCYAILLYESFNRPRAYQLMENWILYPAGFARSLGPMQVQTPIRLSDAELVKIGVERACAAFDRATAAVVADPELVDVFLRRDVNEGFESSEVIHESSELSFDTLHPHLQRLIVLKAAAEYNVRSDYPAEVASIFEFLRDEFYMDLNVELRANKRKLKD